MFKTIVLALDASEGSRAAVPIATELARHNGAQIVIAHVEQDIVGKGGAPVPPTEDEIQAELRRQAEELSKEGIDQGSRFGTSCSAGPPTGLRRSRMRLMRT
jgi:nucleotide-binding universal stress UspA family protein